MEYTVEHAVNAFMREHHLLASVAAFATGWGTTAFAVAAFALWLLDPPRGVGQARLACASGLTAGAVALLGNQLISGLLWDRPRPYEAHPGGIVPLVAASHDPSFPSDHASAAFGIAFGILLVARRAGLVMLVWAAVIGASRVLVGMHYPTDILAGLAVGLGAALLVAGPLRPAVRAIVALVARATDPLLRRIEEVPAVRATVGSGSVRRRAVLVAGAVLAVVFALRIGGPLLDEMPLAVLAAWVGIVALAARAAGHRVRPLS